jgi:FAD synthetase
MSTASIIIIGDEILSGKFRDENTPWLIDECRKLGLKIRSIHIIPDAIPTIAHYVQQESKASTYVFTTGGVGPTHDDMTMSGIATAFGDCLIEHPELRKIITDKMGEHQGALRMAMVPSTTELLPSRRGYFPQVKVGNVFVFPGVPKLMKVKFGAITHLLVGKQSYNEKVYLSVRETNIAIGLEGIQARFPNTAIGSYPQFEAGDIRVILTVEGSERAEVEQVRDVLENAFSDYLLPPPNKES